jgi:UPF0755 protein
MMTARTKKFIILTVFFLVGLAAALAYAVFGSGTGFEEKSKYVFIYPDKTSKADVLATLNSNEIIKGEKLFSFVANRLNMWAKLKPGRYEIKKGTSVLNMVRMFRNNNQSVVKLVINKLRTKEDLAKLVGKNLSVDSARFMTFINSKENLLAAGFEDAVLLDSNTFMAAVIPDTYQFYWLNSPENIVTKLFKNYQRFWSADKRLIKGGQAGFTPVEITTIASIVEEETNKNDEKGNVASVYMNRLAKGMNLGADPTVKFALKDFALTRIYYKHLSVASPYNTYRNKGLPPGPICTPSKISIDAVLNAPKTDYIFFVAKSDFSGYHHFSSNFAEHDRYAKIYQQALTEWMERKQKK